MDRNKAFTLMEFVLIAVVIAILAAIVQSQFPSKLVQLHDATNRLKSTLFYMRSWAMAQQAMSRVNFTSSTQYSLTQSNGTTAILNPATNSNIVTLPYSATLATSGLPNGYVAFNPEGMPYLSTSTPLSSNAVITLSLGGYSQTITIYAQTGNIVSS